MCINTWLPASKVYLFEISRFPLRAGDHSDHHAPSSAPAHFLQCFLRCLHLLAASQPENPGKKPVRYQRHGLKNSNFQLPSLDWNQVTGGLRESSDDLWVPSPFFWRKNPSSTQLFFSVDTHIILPWCGRPTALHSHRSTPSLARCQLHGKSEGSLDSNMKNGVHMGPQTIPGKITRGDPCWFLGKLSLWAGDHHPAWNQMDEYQGASSERRVPAASSHQRCDVGHHHECWEGLDANAAKVTVNVTKKDISTELTWNILINKMLAPSQKQFQSVKILAKFAVALSGPSYLFLINYPDIYIHTESLSYSSTIALPSINRQRRLWRTSSSSKTQGSPCPKSSCFQSSA